MQVLSFHQLTEGYFSSALGSLGQGGTCGWRGELPGDGGWRTACVYRPVKSWSPGVVIWAFLSESWCSFGEVASGREGWEAFCAGVSSLTISNMVPGSAETSPSSCCCGSLEIQGACSSGNVGPQKSCAGASERDGCKSGEPGLSPGFLSSPSWSAL